MGNHGLPKTVSLVNVPQPVFSLFRGSESAIIAHNSLFGQSGIESNPLEFPLFHWDNPALPPSRRHGFGLRLPFWLVAAFRGPSTVKGTASLEANAQVGRGFPGMRPPYLKDKLCGPVQCL